MCGSSPAISDWQRRSACRASRTWRCSTGRFRAGLCACPFSRDAESSERSAGRAPLRRLRVAAKRRSTPNSPASPPDTASRRETAAGRSQRRAARKYLSPSQSGNSSTRSTSTHSSVPSTLPACGSPVNRSMRKMKPSQSSPFAPKPGQLIVPQSRSDSHSIPASSRISRRMQATTSSLASILPPRPLYLPRCRSFGRRLR